MFLQYRQRRAAIQMLEKEDLRASQDNINGAGGGLEDTNVSANFTSSVDNLLSEGKPTEESTYDSLQPKTRVEESVYDSLNPQSTVLQNEYITSPRLTTDNRQV